MELLIAIVISAVTGVTKWLTKKLGVEKSKTLAMTFVLIASFVGAWLYTQQIVTTDMINSFMKLALMAVGWYELVWNRIFKPGFERLTNFEV